jgi:hypothetical protein
LKWNYLAEVTIVTPSDNNKNTSYLGDSKVADLMQDRVPSKKTGTIGNMWKLRCKIEKKFTTIPITERIVVGRTMDSDVVDFDLTPYDAYHFGVSRHHAVMSLVEGFLYIEDLGSTNGTRINGFQLTSKQKYRLRDGDEIEFARLRMTIRMEKK